MQKTLVQQKLSLFTTITVMVAVSCIIPTWLHSRSAYTTLHLNTAVPVWYSCYSRPSCLVYMKSNNEGYQLSHAISL